MSHEIATVGGRDAFVSAREIPWHNLGTVLDHNPTTAEALHTIGADAEVTKQPLHTYQSTEFGDMPLEVPGRYATVWQLPEGPRVLGVVGERYEVLQNWDAFASVDTICDLHGAAHVETAGLLRDGRQVFITTLMGEDIVLDPQGAADRVRPYLAALNSHDGSKAFTLMLTPTRIVCANTLALAFRDATAKFTIRHTSSMTGRVQEARRALGISFRYLEAFEAEANRMIQTEITRREFDSIVSAVFPEPKATGTDSTKSATQYRNLRDQVDALMWSAATQENIRGTRWAAFNAIGEYLDWYRPVKGAGQDQAGQDRLRSEASVTSDLIAGQKIRAAELLSV